MNIQQGPTITTPEAAAEGMVAPGQENILEQFIAEQQQQQEPELLLGKFRTQEDLAKAYQELERKQGQQSQKTESPADPSTTAPQEFTREQAVADYGEGLTAAFESAELNPYEIKALVEGGQDYSQFVPKLAEATGYPTSIVEQYLASFKPAAAAESTQASLTSGDEAELKAMVGGEDSFNQLSQWAAKSLPPQELADYNAIVDGGNKDAIRWALKALQARAASPDAVVEPKLLGGGNASAPTRFESQQQVLDAMNKRNARGERLYDVDEAYQNRLKQILATSDVF